MDWQVGPDFLSHEQVARGVVGHLRQLDPGSVVAVQGSWGKGKTDVLGRAHRLIAQDEVAHGWPAPLWINPWSYARPDLVTPLLTQMLERMPAETRSGATILKLGAQALLRAANAIAFKGINVVVPDMGFLSAASTPIDELINALFDDPTRTNELDVDPVLVMGTRFRELVASYLELLGHERSALVVFIDDIDRCLPDHQIAMLEAMHFLTAAGAPAYFVVAIDPDLVRESAITHYKVRTFNTDLYLNKIFDLRIDLPLPSVEDFTALIEKHLEEEILGESGPTSIRQFFDAKCDIPALTKGLVGMLSLPELNNPRTLKRFFQRVRLFIANSDGDPQLHFDQETAAAFFAWCALCERWPWVREVCNYVLPKYHRRVLNDVRDHFAGTVELPKHWALRMRNVEEAPDLQEFLAVHLPRRHDVDYAVIDMALKARGL